MPWSTTQTLVGCRSPEPIRNRRTDPFRIGRSDREDRVDASCVDLAQSLIQHVCVFGRVLGCVEYSDGAAFGAELLCAAREIVRFHALDGCGG